jgi:hypothetical protein
VCSSDLSLSGGRSVRNADRQELIAKGFGGSRLLVAELFFSRFDLAAGLIGEPAFACRTGNLAGNLVFQDSWSFRAVGLSGQLVFQDS